MLSELSTAAYKQVAYFLKILFYLNEILLRTEVLPQLVNKWILQGKGRTDSRL